MIQSKDNSVKEGLSRTFGLVTNRGCSREEGGLVRKEGEEEKDEERGGREPLIPFGKGG